MQRTLVGVVLLEGNPTEVDARSDGMEFPLALESQWNDGSCRLSGAPRNLSLGGMTQGPSRPRSSACDGAGGVPAAASCLGVSESKKGGMFTLPGIDAVQRSLAINKLTGTNALGCLQFDSSWLGPTMIGPGESGHHRPRTKGVVQA